MRRGPDHPRPTVRPQGWPSDAHELKSLTSRLETYASDLERLVYDRSRDLEHSETRTREFFDASPDLHLAIDARGRIAQVNRRVVSTLGLSERHICGKHFFRLLDPAARRRVRGAAQAFAASGAIDNLELSLTGAVPQTLEVVVSARAIGPGESGPWQGAWVVLRDVTRRNTLQRQLRQVDRLALTGRMAAGVAHEINNPLQALLMHLAVVEGALPEDFSQRESWERVREAVTRVRQIVADLLDLHRGPNQDGKGADANRVIEEALGLTRTQFRKSGIRIRTELEGDLPRIAISGRQLYQVVLNLLLNAHAAMPGGGRLRVRTHQKRHRSEVEIEITDSGRGIEEKALARIFEPFGSGEQGTGLGLFVSYGLIRDAGGHVRIDSLKDRGTSFRVFLPPHREGR